MSLIALIVILVALGVGLWWVNSTPKMNSTIKTLLNFVLIATAVILVLSAFGIWQEIRDVKVPKL